jgi:hypothetical protein
VAFIVIIIAALAFNFIPTIIAKRRGMASVVGLFVVNLLFGWTVVGWVVCLIWACSGQTHDQLELERLALASERLGAGR